MEIKPFGFNILVKPTEKKQTSYADQKSLCEYGEVIAVGDEVTRIKVGDTIGYTVFGVNHLQVEDQKYYFIPETSEFVLGTIIKDDLQSPIKLS